MKTRTRSGSLVQVSLFVFALAACVATGGPQYEVISSQTVSGVSLDMVRRNQLDAEGNAVGSPDYGILDRARTFHACGQSPCKESDFQRVAAKASTSDAESEGPSGGGGGGGGGGM